MRKLIAWGLAAILAGACGTDNSRTATFKGMEFDSIVVDSTLVLSKADDSPQCHVRLSIQYAKGKNAELINHSLLRSGILSPDYLSLGTEKLTTQQSADSFVCRFLSDYQRDYGELYRADTEHASSYNCTYTVDTRTYNGADETLCYEARVYTHAGGMHGITQTIVRNFKVETGEMLSLEQVFKPGSEPALRELIIKELANRFDVNGLDGLQSKGIFVDGNVYVPENFILGSDNVTFIYCEDEVAPHAVGELRAEIERSDMKKLLK